MFRLFGIFLLCFALSTGEPVCSRFHYEEQTLKKMIMVELLVEKLQTELEVTKRTVNDALAGWENEREISKGELKDALTEWENERVASKRELNELQVSVKEDIVEIKEAVKENILFTAREIKNKSPVQGETLVFTTTISNKDSGYDNKTGIFTAPVQGVFMFTLQLCIHNMKYMYFEIVADNVSLLKGINIDDYNRWSSCYTKSVPAFINAGEQVWVKTGRTEENALWESAGENWNMFSGFLIHN